MNLYLLLYKSLFPGKYRHYLQRAGGNVDMCHETLLHGTFYEEYESYGFATKSESERREYLTDAVRDRICRRVNSRQGSRIISNKYATYTHLRQFYHRRIWLLRTQHDIDDILNHLSHHTYPTAPAHSSPSSLVSKPPDNCGGRGVELLTATTKEQWCHILSDKQGMMIEEPIRQVPELAQWNPSSVNTIRMNTFRRGDSVDVFTAFIRTGRQGSFVDNGLQGGLFASIDTHTGIIYTDGYDEKCVAHTVHPDSGIPYKGVAIPRWEEAVSLAKAMALAMPGMTYIGWDLALTPAGWEPVEANRGEFIAQQITQHRGLRKEFEKACGL